VLKLCMYGHVEQQTFIRMGSAVQYNSLSSRFHLTVCKASTG
jgi:hypothetical protein